MATAAYDHIESPGDVLIGGTLAFRRGDAIPLDTAKRYGIKGDKIEGLVGPDEVFRDIAVVVTDEGAKSYEAKGDGPAAAPAATTKPRGA